MKKRTGRMHWAAEDDKERLEPWKPIALRQENGFTIKVYEAACAQGYRQQESVRPKRVTY